jgi:hypothetical protein
MALQVCTFLFNISFLNKIIGKFDKQVFEKELAFKFVLFVLHFLFEKISYKFDK